MSRYIGRKTFFNNDDFYTKLLADRGVVGVRQYSTPILEHPTDRQVASLSTIPHVWKVGDKLFKLAHDHYGDSKMWWVIAWFNKKPAESNYNIGDVLYIPHPIDRVLSYLES